MHNSELKYIATYLIIFVVVLGMLIGGWIFYITHYESAIRDQIKAVTDIHVAEIQELENQITADQNLTHQQKIYLHRVLADYSRGYHSDHYYLIDAGLSNSASFEELMDALDSAHDKAVLYEFHIKEMKKKHDNFVSFYPNKIILDLISQVSVETINKK